MHQEIEAKIRLTPQRRQDLVARLQSRFGSPSAQWRVTDTYFDTPGLALRSADSGMRIRTRRDASGSDEALITYKGPRLKSVLKSRPELEFAVGDPAAAGQFLEALGYAPMLVIEKRRVRWSVNGLQIELDELPGLGFFVEIEGPDESSVLSMREELGLADLPLEDRSFKAMVLQFLKDQGRKGHRLVFDDLLTDDSAQ